MDKMKITTEVFVVLKHAPARKIILSHNTEERKKEFLFLNFVKINGCSWQDMCALMKNLSTNERSSTEKYKQNILT